MKYQKNHLVVLTTIFAIVANLLGRDLATKLYLPVWFDSFGTIFISYVYGPVCGAIVGLVNNIIYGIFVDEQSIFCFIGLLIGVITGFLAKKGAFESAFRVMTLGAGLSIMCTLLSVPINIFMFEGRIGNVVGDQIVLMCVNNSIPNVAAIFIAQFYIEFLDKLVSVYGVYLIIQMMRHRNKKAKKEGSHGVSMMIVILCLSCLSSVNVYAADSVDADNNKKVEVNEDYGTYTHTIYGSDDGLLAGEANDIVQTKEGQLWIGTYAGLYSYDGMTFTQYNDIDSIKNVNDLYADEEGRLWVCTNDNGVTMMINGHTMNVIDSESGLLSNSIKSIISDTNGHYFIGSTGGLSIITLSGGVQITKSFPEIKNTVRMTANQNGEVLAVTNNGEVYHFKDGELTDDTIVASGEYVITTAFYSSDERIYVGTDTDTIIIYNPVAGKLVRQEFVCHGLEHINSFFETDNGEIFVCADNGIGYFNKNRIYKSINVEQFNSSIDNMVIDYQGGVWFASSRLGLLKLCKSPFSYIFSEVGEAARVVNSVSYLNGQLLCGTDKGLVIVDENKKKTISNELTELLDGVRVRNINVDSHNNVWISTSGSGLYKIRIVGDKSIIKIYNETNGMPGKRVRASCQLSNGEIVAVGDDGISFIDSEGIIGTITAKDNLVNPKSLCVLEYHDKVYVGSDGGGITVIDNHAIEKTITKVNGLSSDVVMKMVYDHRSDGVFIVTSNGLCYMAPNGIVTHLDKFPYSNNYDIISGKNYSMWVLSSAGIYVTTSKQLIENRNKDYELLNSKRGLRSSITANSYSCVVGGNLYLCCDSDIVKVNIDDYNFGSQSYRMVLNSVTVDGHDFEISRNHPLNIKADASSITFEPEILNYSLNDPYISYYLEGVDTGENIIILSDLKSITYSDLKPGKYVFKISVLDSSKQKIIETGSYTIIKEMEMYQAWWFKVYICAVAALIIMWITWYITRSGMHKTMLKQKLELEYAKKQISMGNETILSIARTVDAKDSNTSQHSFRVSQYSAAIAKRYGFDEEKCENIRQMALLHDIGKIGIPDAILNKPAKLTDEEYEIMKSHVVRGGEILKEFTLIENVNIGALYHHERYDGKGYCSGLAGEAIPIEARIIGIADAFDAMTANRVYRKQLDIDFVINELKRCRGSQFDPKLTDIMLMLIDEGDIDVEALYKESKGDR